MVITDCIQSDVLAPEPSNVPPSCKEISPAFKLIVTTLSWSIASALASCGKAKWGNFLYDEGQYFFMTTL